LLTTLFLKKAGEAAGEQRGVIKTDLILKGKGKIPNLSPFPLPLFPTSARDSMSGAHKEQLKYLFPVPRSLFLRQVLYTRKQALKLMISCV